jgi:hypothetical protein
MSALVEELEGIDLGDARINRRARRVLSKLGEKPMLSIPGACGGWDETRGAYRLFDHPGVTAEKVLQPHYACTERRAREHPRVLCIQDTSELDYTGKTDIEGLGPLNYETRRGLYLHPTLALTPDRVCLGVLDVWTWARPPGSLGKDNGTRPIEEKESIRWLEGFARINELAERTPGTDFVYIADREADIYELFVEAPCPESGADWLIRGRHHDRLLGDGTKLRGKLDKAPALTELRFDQPASAGRAPRPVHQQLKSVRVTLKAPSRPDRTLLDVEVTAILATEINPPDAQEPVEWLLLTNLPVDTAEQAIEKLQWYLCRWQIEIYFKILKSGCRIEELQLEKLERLEPALALYRQLSPGVSSF